MMYLSTLLINVGDNPDRPRPGRLWLRNLYRVHQRLAMAFPADRRKSEDAAFLAPYKPDDFPEQRHLATCSESLVSSDRLRQVHSPRGDGAGFLFRVDPLPPGRAIIVILSHQQPDWNYAFGLIPGLLDPATGRPIGNAGVLLAAPPEPPRPWNVALPHGARFRFRLNANPTKKTGTLPKQDRLAKVQGRHGSRVPVKPEDFVKWLLDRSEPNGFRLVEPISQTLTTVAGYVYVAKNADSGKGQRLRSVRYEGLLEITDAGRFQRAVAAGIGPAKAYGFGLLSLARPG